MGRKNGHQPSDFGELADDGRGIIRGFKPGDVLSFYLISQYESREGVKRLERFETTDIFRGAFFLCHGGDLQSIRFERGGKRLATFLIQGEGLSDLDKAYRTGKALVNPGQFREMLNCLRDLLFARLRDEERRDDSEGEGRGNKAGP